MSLFPTFFWVFYTAKILQKARTGIKQSQGWGNLTSVNMEFWFVSTRCLCQIEVFSLPTFLPGTCRISFEFICSLSAMFCFYLTKVDLFFSKSCFLPLTMYSEFVWGVFFEVFPELCCKFTDRRNWVFSWSLVLGFPPHLQPLWRWAVMCLPAPLKF